MILTPTRPRRDGAMLAAPAISEQWMTGDDHLERADEEVAEELRGPSTQGPDGFRAAVAERDADDGAESGPIRIRDSRFGEIPTQHGFNPQWLCKTTKRKNGSSSRTWD